MTERLLAACSPCAKSFHVISIVDRLHRATMRDRQESFDGFPTDSLGRTGWIFEFRELFFQRSEFTKQTVILRIWHQRFCIDVIRGIRTIEEFAKFFDLRLGDLIHQRKISVARGAAPSTLPWERSGMSHRSDQLVFLCPHRFQELAAGFRVRCRY